MKKNKVGNHTGSYGPYAFHYAGLRCDKNGLYEYENDTMYNRKDTGTPIKISERARRYLNKRNLGKVNNILR